MRPDHIFDYSDLVDSPEFEEFFTVFWKLTNIPLALVDPKVNGNNKLFCPEEQFNPICKVLRSHPEGEKKCHQFDYAKMEDAVKEHKGICYQCHAGLMDFAVPIFVGNRHIATINCGQIMSKAPTEKGFDELWDNVVDLSLDKKTLREAYFKSPYMPPDKIKTVLKLLSFFADYFCEVGVRLRLLEKRDNKYPEIEKATEYLKKHFSEPIVVSDVAYYVAFSRPYFSRLFKKVKGVSFTQYLQELRLEEVKKLLRNTDVAISKIAFNCGFSNLSYFNVFFRRMMQCSPRQYRARNNVSQQ